MFWRAGGLGYGYSSIAIGGGGIYTAGNVGDLVCLDANTGKKLWGLNILDTFKGERIHRALSESLLVDGGRVPAGCLQCDQGMPQAAAELWKPLTGP